MNPLDSPALGSETDRGSANQSGLTLRLRNATGSL